MQSLAIIGTGVAGMGLAHLVQKEYAVTLFEKNSYIGGHTNTVYVTEGDHSVPIDTGFMVFNQVTYPLILRLFHQLEVPMKKTDMSFAVRHSPTDLEYSGTGLNGLFRQRRNLMSLSFIRMLLAIDRFNSDALEILKDPRYDQWTISDLVEARDYGEDFFHKYLIPMSSAVWSTPPEKMQQFPAKTLLRFFHNHGFLGLSTQHQWYTIDGGSEVYKQRLITPFKNRIRLDQNIQSIRLQDDGRVSIQHQDGTRETFDKLVFACHADDALRLLGQPSPLQKELLRCFSYQENTTILHSDDKVMPKLRGVWSSWNYRIDVDAEGRVHPTTIYWMNRLQGVGESVPYFVSLNEPGTIDPDKIHRRITYHHPLFDSDAIEAQKRLHELNESPDPFYFCGSYFRYGFHEDAFMSAVDLARHLLGERTMVTPASALRSRLVNAIVEHKRLREGQSHSFTYRVFYGLIDVDEIPQLDQALWTFSARGRSLYSLGSRDFLDHGQSDIKGNLQHWLRARGHEADVQRVLVFAHLRTLGVNFNPLSVFFVETSQETLCLAEVDNTFGEAKLYLLGPLGQAGHLCKRLPKEYYVSPFIEHNADFIFDIRRNDDTLKVQVTTIKDQEPILYASMQGTLQPVSDWSLLNYFVRMPLTPIKVFGAIHWQALRLMIKRIPFLRKEDHPEMQRDYYVHKDHKQHIT